VLSNEANAFEVFVTAGGAELAEGVMLNVDDGKAEEEPDESPKGDEAACALMLDGCRRRSLAGTHCT